MPEARTQTGRNEPPPPPWGLIADDLTGACDAAAPFAERGLAVKMLLSRDPREVVSGGLTALSTESRDLALEAAKQRVSAACEWCQGHGVRIIFKKIDSVLRGNVADEVAAVLESGGFQHSILTPAFPKMGRVVIGGELRLPAHKEFTPIDLPGHFSGMDSIRIADAANDADLAAIVETAFHSDPPPLLAGSAGLATALASYLAARIPSRGNRLKPPRCDAALYFLGTPHTATAAQLDYLIRQRESEVHELEDFQMDAAARANNRLIVRAGWQNTSAEQCSPLFDWLDLHPRAGIVLSGGDTAAFFCQAAGARAIELGGEAFPGIPWGTLCGGRADGRYVVTKSGGFGAPSTLLEVDDFLRNPSHRS